LRLEADIDGRYTRSENATVRCRKSAVGYVQLLYQTNDLRFAVLLQEMLWKISTMPHV
jgi:hypothetical protein